MAKHGFIGDPEAGPAGHANPDAVAPGETANNLGDFIGDSELAGGHIDTSDEVDDTEEEVEDNESSLIGDDEDSTDQDVDTDESDSGDDAGDEDDDEVEFTIDQIIRAGAVGLTEAQVSQFDSSAALEASIAALQARPPVQPAPQQPQPAPQPQPEVADFEIKPYVSKLKKGGDYTDEQILEDQEAMSQYYAEQMAEMQKQVQAANQSVQTLNAQMQNATQRQTYEFCEAQFKTLAEDHADLIGKGPTSSLAPGSKEYVNRAAVVQEAILQGQIHPELTPDQTFRMALQVRLQPSLIAQATKKVRKAVAKRNAKASPKPSARKGKKGADAIPKGRKRVSAMMRDKSTKLGKKAAAFFDKLK